MNNKVSDEVMAKAQDIRLVIFDVDGVLTDGGLYFTDDGREMKKFNVKDGLGISLLIKHDIEVAVITGRSSVIVADRMRSLGVNHVYQGRLNKLETYENLKSALQIDDQHVAFVGDDLIDIPIMEQCGLPVAVADAHESVIAKACWVTSKKGGKGAARQVCDVLLNSHGIEVNGYEFTGQQ